MSHDDEIAGMANATITYEIARLEAGPWPPAGDDRIYLKALLEEQALRGD